MAKRSDDTVFENINNRLGFEQAVVRAYDSKKFTTKQIALNYGISPRTIVRYAKKWGKGRTQADGNRVAAPLSPKHRVRSTVVLKKPLGKSYDNQLSQMRHIIVGLMQEQGRNFNQCEQCMAYIPDRKFTLHHTKYDGATFHDLQIVCVKCNTAPQNRYLD